MPHWSNPFKINTRAFFASLNITRFHWKSHKIQGYFGKYFFNIKPFEGDALRAHKLMLNIQEDSTLQAYKKRWGDNGSENYRGDHSSSSPIT